MTSSMPALTIAKAPERQTWATPQSLFDGLDREFHFTKDVAAEAWNAKCAEFISSAEDALKVPWGTKQTCWCNPPYRDVRPWFVKANEEAELGNSTVLLVRASVGSKWFHDVVMMQSKWWFFRDRVRFQAPPGIPSTSPAFDSMLVVFGPSVLPGFGGTRCPISGKVLYVNLAA